MDARIEKLDITAYTIPTDFPEADGTLSWNSTTIVVVEATAGGVRSIGYSYADTATARLILDLLSSIVIGRDAMDVPASWDAMVHAIRNLGRPGIVSMAIAAVDAALWDLKARLLDISLVTLLGAVRESVPIYGSGGFTSYPIARLQEQLGGWVSAGIPRVKMKIGSHPGDDIDRVRAARSDRTCVAGGIVRGRERRVQPQAGAGTGRGVCGVRRDVVRGTGVVGRYGRTAIDPRPGAEGYGDRGRRIRVRPVVFSPDARCLRGGCVAGGRVAVRGHLEFSSCGRVVRRALDGAVRAHCAVAARASVLRARQRAPSRVLPRSRAYRAHVVRRCAHAGRWRPAARSRATRPGPRAQTTGR